MQFVDELAAGVVLIRPALQSPDYVAGAAGWAVKVDGSAEFNNITIRGQGTSDPLVVGDDDSPQVVVRTTAGNGLIVFPTNRPVEDLASTVGSAVIDEGAVNERAELQMAGPTVNGSPQGVRVVLSSRPQNGTDVARFAVQNRTGTTNYFTADGDQILATGRPLTAERDAGNEVAVRTHVKGEAQPRLSVAADGGIQWGPGTAGPDVNLYRGAPDVLQTDDTLVVLGEFHPRNLVRATRPTSGDSQYETRVTGDSHARWFVRAGGEVWWGSGAAVQDVRLYRPGAGALAVDGDLSAYNFPAGSWSTWAPSWTTSTGSALPSYGNATFDCRWTFVGKTVMAHINITFGNTTNFGAGATTADDWRFSLPVTAASAMQALGFVEINAGIAARAVCRVRAVTTSQWCIEFSSGLTDGSNPANKNIVDAVTPFVWTAADSIRGTLVYEAA